MADITAASGASPDADSIDLFVRLVRSLGSGRGDEKVVAEEVQRLYGNLWAHTVEDAWQLVPVTMGDWLARCTTTPKLAS